MTKSTLVLWAMSGTLTVAAYLLGRYGGAPPHILMMITYHAGVGAGLALSAKIKSDKDPR